MVTIGPKTQGKDFNYFNRFTVSDTTYPSSPQVIITFRGPQRLIFTIASGGPVFYSFNGTTDHGDLVASTPREKMEFITRPDKLIWFRAGSSIEIAVEAYHIGV